MKKFLKVFTLLVLTFTMAVSLTACTFIMKEGAFTPGGNNIPAELLNVTIKEQPTESRQLLTLEQANAKVERSIVAIETTGGLGAGVIVDIGVDGGDENIIYIVTCHHVISSKGDILVYIPDVENPDNYLNQDYIFSGKIGGNIADNQDKAVTLVGGDFKSDIAVIKIDLNKPAYSGNTLSLTKIVKAVVPASDYKVTQGEAVFAIGNPTGSLPGWLCSGIVASLEENVPVSDIGNMKLMGISAPTNPGNSGGGLFNMYGELIGITNAGNTAYDAINFAIPLYTSDKDVDGQIDNGVVNIVKQLVATAVATPTNYGYIVGRKTMLGITVAKGTNPSNNQEYTYIYDVVENGVADLEGIKKNDKIVGIKVNGEDLTTVDTYEEINQTMSALVVGDVLVLKLQRTTMPNQVESLEITINITQFRFCDTGM